MGLPSILPSSRSRAAVAIVFSGPDLALDPANRVRRSHCSPPSTVSCRVLACPSSRHSSATNGALGSDRRVRRGSLSCPSTEVGECTVTCRQRRPLWTPVAASSARRGRRSRCGRPSLRRTSGRALGAIGERCSASDGRDCAAPVFAQDPLEMVAIEP